MIKIIVNRHVGSRRIEQKNKKNTQLLRSTFFIKKATQQRHQPLFSYVLDH